LGEALREQYKQVLNEPVPERLKKLIEELKEKEKKERDRQKD
jgi:phage-related holin